MESWLELDFFNSPKFKQITDFLAQERRLGKLVLPDRRHILRALAHTPPDKVKAVILGQDPYPTRGHANGLCFSVNPGVTPLPKSLINIYHELKNDLGIVKESGDLTDWADQGVLLLNTTLTVVEGQPNSHSGIGWEILSTEVIRYLSEYRDTIVYIMWGKNAQKKEMYINPMKNLIIKSPHPSPLSAYRGFFGSAPFSQTNKYLTEAERNPINW